MIPLTVYTLTVPFYYREQYFYSRPYMVTSTNEALEGFIEIWGYWQNNYRDTGYFCKKKYRDMGYLDQF